MLQYEARCISRDDKRDYSVVQVVAVPDHEEMRHDVLEVPIKTSLG